MGAKVQLPFSYGLRDSNCNSAKFDVKLLSFDHPDTGVEMTQT